MAGQLWCWRGRARRKLLETALTDAAKCINTVIEPLARFVQVVKEFAQALVARHPSRIRLDRRPKIDASGNSIFKITESSARQAGEDSTADHAALGLLGDNDGATVDAGFNF